MTDLSALGLVSFGIVLTLAVLGGFVLYVFRGHRADWTGLRIVRSDSWKSPLKSINWADAIPPGEELPPIRVAPKQSDFEGRTTSGAWDYANRGDSERPPAVQQHGARTHDET